MVGVSIDMYGRPTQPVTHTVEGRTENGVAQKRSIFEAGGFELNYFR